MMPAIFVLDVEEFAPLVDHARGRPELSLRGPSQGYWRIDAQGEMRFSRKELGFNAAVWNGALTGGLIGKVVQFDRDTLHIVEAAS